jgi:hypothetical protein
MEEFDCTEIFKYWKKGFSTKTGIIYGISDKGIITGKTYARGAEVMMIAGVPEKDYEQIANLLAEFPLHDSGKIETRKRLNDIIKEVGVKPKPGLHLVMSFHSESFKQAKSVGVVSSTITDIK